MRQAQHARFVLILLGFLVQWLTLAMFPVLVVMYWCLALAEESKVEADFGDAYKDYAVKTPQFISHLRSRTPIASQPPG